ncbi:MAG: alkaline phosphatase family protein [Acidobacteriaceae bacterium]
MSNVRIHWIPRFLYPATLISCFAALLLSTGCGIFTGNSTHHLTVSISASPASIASGSSSTLTVTAIGASQVIVTGSDGSSYTLQPAGGSQPVSPTATTVYTATATDSAGKSTATTTVTVTPVQQPSPTVSVSASPTSISAGSSSILSVTATNATQVTLAGNDGSSYTLAPSGGTQAVTPSTTTVYTATASGAGGTATASVTVTVAATPAPTVTITANPASINAGGSSTLSVSASNATQVTLTGSDGSSYPVGPSGGSQSVTPAATTIYTATATGPGGNISASATVTVTPLPTPTVTIAADPATVSCGNSSLLTVVATNSTQVTVTGTDGSSYTLQPAGGTQKVNPAATTNYTATATGTGGSITAEATVTVDTSKGINCIDHVIFMLQENHTFDNYFGMLNPYRIAQGWNKGDDGQIYNVDGIDDKLATISNQDSEGDTYSLFKFKTTCIDDETSDWLASYGQVTLYNHKVGRPTLMNGFVSNAEGYAKYCAKSGSCSGEFSDTTGKRAMGYYDQDFLNYYYYMASQFALSDRWFSPVSSKSIPNRIATFTGGTTQGLVKDPGNDDHLTQLDINNIFQELDAAKVSWKIYYTVTNGFCLDEDDCNPGPSEYPATTFSTLQYSYHLLHGNTSANPCNPPTQPSSVVGDASNSFCIDPTHIAPLNDPQYGYFADLKNGTLPSFAFIEAGYGRNDEHPGSSQSIFAGQAEVAKIINSLMTSSSWKDSVFFLSYDEGGGPYDHVPPVPGHSNDYTDPSLGTIPDISSIAVNPDSYNPCVPSGGIATTHCDLGASDPGASPDDAPAQQGFAAQLGFRVPNMVVSPFTKRHYVSHIPMDHTAILKFVENRFIGPDAHLTARDEAQPNLLDFFDFTDAPWETPPTPPAPDNASGTCTPTDMGP